VEVSLFLGLLLTTHAMLAVSLFPTKPHASSSTHRRAQSLGTWLMPTGSTVTLLPPAATTTTTTLPTPSVAATALSDDRYGDLVRRPRVRTAGARPSASASASAAASASASAAASAAAAAAAAVDVRADARARGFRAPDNGGECAQTHRRYRSWAAQADVNVALPPSLHAPSAAIAASSRRARRGTAERSGGQPGASAPSSLAHSYDVSTHSRSLERQSSLELERLAQLEEFVEAKQRELAQRGVIPDSLGSARATLASASTAVPTKTRSATNVSAVNRRLAAKVDDLELELEQMRRRTQDICDRIARLEHERCQAPDPSEMLAGASRDHLPPPVLPPAPAPALFPSSATMYNNHVVPKPVRFSRERLDREGLITPEPKHPSFTPVSFSNARAMSPATSGRPSFFGPSPSTAFVNFR
jgi:hypothetical protein